jgi:CRP-like cAMP-binding protein
LELFLGLDLDFAQAFVSELDIELFSEGDTIMTQGTLGTTMAFLLEGSVDVSKDGHWISTLGPGSLFGEMVCLGLSSKRSCTIEAKGFCDCRCIHLRNFKMLLNRFPEAKKHFERVAALRQEALKEIESINAAEARFERAKRRACKVHVDLLSGKMQSILGASVEEKENLHVNAIKIFTQADPGGNCAHEKASLLAAGWMPSIVDDSFLFKSSDRAGTDNEAEHLESCRSHCANGYDGRLCHMACSPSNMDLLKASTIHPPQILVAVGD